MQKEVCSSPIYGPHSAWGPINPPACGGRTGRQTTISLFLIFLLFSSFFATPYLAASAEPGILIVKIKTAKDAAKLLDFGNKAELLFDRVYRLRVADKQGMLNLLKMQPWVEYAEEDGLIKIQLNAADPLFVLDQQELTKQWYLPKIQIHQAWERTTGSGITIAVVDTGIDGRHEDLSDGRVIRGYLSYCQTFAPNSDDCLVHISNELAPGVNSDDNGHGTIVAGILGAVSNNDRGIAGINWQVRLMPIKVLDSQGSGLASDVAAGIRWASDNGAKIINLSIGGSGLQGGQVLQEAISYAFQRGVLVVAASGNDAAITGIDLNLNPILPVCADGGQNMVVGVAAVDINDRKARFSNYGSNCVDIAAPGTGTFIDKQQKQGLVSTYYDPSRPGEQNLYVYAVGTSVAAPMVSGVAGLIMSAFPDLDVKAVRDRLIGSGDNIDYLNLTTGCNGGSCAGQIGQGRLNALKAVTTVATFPSGALIRSPQGQVYLIERGLKRLISAFVLSQRFPGATIITATAEQISSFPTGTPIPPADGSLIKEPASPLVYLVEGGERHGLSYLAFISRKFKFADVVTIPAQELVEYPLGEDAAVLDGALAKTANHPAVFLLEKGERRLLSYFVFLQRGFHNQPIAVLSHEELAKYPVNPKNLLYPPLQGTLLRGDLVSTVYLIEFGKARGMNLAAFQNRGYQFANVKVLPQSEVEGYEKGEDIIE